MSDELLRRLDDNSRVSQWACRACQKGFENHEYHCFGPNTDKCLYSQPELKKTVNKWKIERKEAAARIRELEALVKAMNETHIPIAGNRSDLRPTVQAIITSPKVPHD